MERRSSTCAANAPEVSEVGPGLYFFFFIVILAFCHQTFFFWYFCAFVHQHRDKGLDPLPFWSRQTTCFEWGRYFCCLCARFMCTDRGAGRGCVCKCVSERGDCNTNDDTHPHSLLLLSSSLLDFTTKSNLKRHLENINIHK